MTKLERELADDGYVAVNRSYDAFDEGIRELAPLAIEPAIAECREQAAAPIHFVTHSLGGILVRVVLESGRPPELGRVVMLGPPNQGSEVVDVLGGTPIYRWFGGKAGVQLGTELPDSVPRQLGPADFELGVIAGNRSVNLLLSRYLPGADDGKVTVESTKLDGMADHIVLPVTHTFMMRNRKAMEHVRHFLENGRFIDN